MSEFFRTLCCVPWVIPTCFFLGVDIFVVLAFVSPPQADPSNEKLIIPRGKLWGQKSAAPPRCGMAVSVTPSHHGAMPADRYLLGLLSPGFPKRNVYTRTYRCIYIYIAHCLLRSKEISTAGNSAHAFPTAAIQHQSQRSWERNASC